MGKGKQFELDIKRDMNDATHEWVKAHRPDFSGNSVGEVADVMVVWQAERYSDQRPCGHPERHVAYVELKKRGNVDEGNRKVVMSGSSKEQNGMDELEELIEESPSWSDTYVGVKFPNRELIVIDAKALLHHLRRGDEGYGPNHYDYRDVDTFHGARLTRGQNISMVKPELDWWQSSTAGDDDHTKLLHSIGVEDYDIK
jgi:hypothetical protein